MRSIFLVLSACAAVSQAAECEAADEATMLQMRNMAHIKKHTKGAKAVLKSLQEVAQSMSKGSRKTMSKDDVDDALNAADAALAALSPTIQTQVTQAQQQIDDAAAAVLVCHEVAAADTRATLQETVDQAASSLQTCQTELEGLTQEAAAQCAIAEDCLCDEAIARRDDKTELCAARTEVYELAYCEHNFACVTHKRCHDSEIAVYETLRADVDAEIATLQQEYIAAEQSTCLMTLIMAAMASGTPIDATAMANCNNVDASVISVNIPTLPATPDTCSLPTLGNPQCAGCEIVSRPSGEWIDQGYPDNYRGWFDVSGCGCNDYCRWVGSGGSGGDPTVQVRHNNDGGWWSCRLAGSDSTGTAVDYFDSFPYPRCGYASPNDGEAPWDECPESDDAIEFQHRCP